MTNTRQDIPTIDELGEDGELCDYCPYRCHELCCQGGCNDAYTNYLNKIKEDK